MCRGKTCPRGDVLASATDKLPCRWQRLAQCQRHPTPHRGAGNWLADKTLPQDMPQDAFHRSRDVGGSAADQTGRGTVFPGVVHRLVMGLAGLDLLGVDRRQILHQRGAADTQGSPGQRSDRGADPRDRATDRGARGAAAKPGGQGRKRVPEAKT